MWSRRWRTYVTGVVMVVMVIPGVFLVASAINRQQDEDREAEAGRELTCARLVERLVGALDESTGRFDGVTALGVDEIPPMPSMRRLRTEAAAFADQLAGADCPQRGALAAVDEWRRAHGARGPLAEAVRAALAANVVDVLDGDDERVRRRLRAGDDLAEVLAEVPAGATVSLPAGRFTLDRSVAVVQDLTLRGAGAGRTLVTSSAEGAGLVLASQVRLRMSGLRVEHRGGRSASVLVLRAGNAELTDVQVSGASRSGPAREGVEMVLGGGSGIVLAGGEGLTLRGSTASDNTMAGLLVATGAPRVEDSTFRGNEVCGICYVGESAGRLVDNFLVGNGAGIMLGERAAPELRGNRVERNEQAGLVIEATARPVVRGNALRGNGGLGAAVYGQASPRLSSNTVRGHREAGILVDVTSESGPRLERNRLEGNGSAGMVFMGESGGRAVGNTCSGAGFGLVLDGSASPVVGSNDCEVQDQRGRRP